MQNASFNLYCLSFVFVRLCERLKKAKVYDPSLSHSSVKDAEHHILYISFKFVIDFFS